MDGWTFDIVSGIIGFVIGAIGVRLLAVFDKRDKKK